MIENQSKNGFFEASRAMDRSQSDGENESFTWSVGSKASSYSDSRDVGNICKTPRVIELGDISERNCYNGKDL